MHVRHISEIGRVGQDQGQLWSQFLKM